MLWKKNGSNISFINGKVGIGINNPAQTLHIHSQTGVNNIQLTKQNATGTIGGAVNFDGNNNLEFWNYENGQIQFATNNTERMVIDTTGKVGIGTTNPKNTLFVKKASSGSTGIFANYGLAISAKDTGSSCGVYIGDWGIGSFGAIQTFNQPLVLNPYSNKVGIGTSNPSGKFHVNNDIVGSDSSFVVLNNGNVAIGSATPSAKLEILDLSSQPDIKLSTVGDYNPFIEYNRTASVTYKNRKWWTGLSGNGSFRIVDATSNLDRIYIDTLGNVGIGTTTPSQKLHIVGQVRIDDSSGFGIIRRPDDAGMAFAVGNGTNTTFGNFEIANGLGSSVNMIVKDGGNVGIGTTSPNSKLHVEGGDVYVGSIGNGVIIRSPDGMCYRVTVANGGGLVTTAVACP